MTRADNDWQALQNQAQIVGNLEVILQLKSLDYEGLVSFLEE